MDVLRKARPVAALALAILLAGCGGGKKEAENRNAIRAVITRFAEAHDASACGLLTDNALRSVYGGFTDPPAKAKRTCIARSKNFKGAPVKITQVNFNDPQTAKVGALSADGRVSYTVTLRENGTQHWRIDQITQGKPK